MCKYLGEVEIEQKDIEEYKDFTSKDWMMYYIEAYGDIDGDHHKKWVLDQIARIAKGTPVIIKKATWDDGTIDYRINTGEPSKEYLEWVEDMRGDYDEEYEEYEYYYDKGIAP